MRIVKFEDSIKILERNEIFLYCIAYPYEISKAHIDTAGDLEKETLLSDGVNYKFFFHKIGKQRGILYDRLNSDSYSVLSIDSFLRAKFSFDSKMFYSSNDSLLFVSKDGTRITETYVPKIKADDSFPDTSILLFSDERTKGVAYSLAPKLDSIRKMKLTKATFIYNKKISDTKTFNEIPRREYVFEIRAINEQISEGIIVLFDKAEHILKTSG